MCVICNKIMFGLLFISHLYINIQYFLLKRNLSFQIMIMIVNFLANILNKLCFVYFINFKMLMLQYYYITNLTQSISITYMFNIKSLFVSPYMAIYYTYTNIKIMTHFKF